MIKGDMNTHVYEADGVKPQIMTEITTLLHTLYVAGKFTKDEVYKMAELACVSDEELHNDVVSRLDSLTSNVLDKIFADAASGKQEAIDALAMLTDTMLKSMGVKDTGDKK